MQAKLRELANIIGRENLFADDAARIVYARSADCAKGTGPGFLPFACARPKHMGQMAALLEFCSGEGIPIAFRGGGTATGSNATPRSADTLLILTSGLARIIDLDAGNSLVRLQPGVTCATLAEAAGSKGLFYPPTPWSAQIATIGGNIAMNTSGPGVARYGTAANFVISLDIYTTAGKKITCRAASATPGAPVAGFPLANLFCGSMGALAFIGEATLRLLPTPESVLNSMFRFHSDAAIAAAEIMEGAFRPTALEIYDPVCASILLDEPECKDWLLEVQFSGGQTETAGNMQSARVICSRHGGIETPVDQIRHNNLRAGLLPALAKRSDFRYEKFSCLPTRLPMLLDEIKAICQRHDQKAALFCHAAAATVHTAIFECGSNTEALLRELFSLELMINNAMVSETESELTRQQWQAQNRGLAEVSQKIRTIFDPSGLLADNVLPGTSLP